ncbi:hypothetical protein ACIQU5_34780 [Streptomyces sp. NPDC090306]|uniref:hypothetical protein n=1 Tax=Streptomyces sp. NPDC090306 TaxID=3365961 RepID=UPI00380B2723
MTPTTPHDRTGPVTEVSTQRGVTATTFAVLWRGRSALAGATARVVGLSGLSALLMLAAVFALSWPLFTHMRNQRIWYLKVEEDPYLHDSSDLVLVAFGTLPLFLLVLGVGSAALQSVCSRAVASGTRAATKDDLLPARTSARLRPVLAVYAIRGLIVWTLPLVVFFVAHSLTGYQLDTPEPLKRGSWPYRLVAGSPAVAVFVGVLLRTVFALAPAAAAAGLGPRAALRRSWSLAFRGAGGVRILALALPLAALTAATVRLVVQLALPLRPLVRHLLEEATGNFFAAYYAGILAPVVVGILAGAALTLPVTCTAFAVLNLRLRPLEDVPSGQMR